MKNKIYYHNLLYTITPGTPLYQVAKISMSGRFGMGNRTRPGPGVAWEQVDTDCTRLTVRHQDLVQSVDVTVASDGRPTQACFDRWSNANPEKQ